MARPLLTVLGWYLPKTDVCVQIDDVDQWLWPVFQTCGHACRVWRDSVCCRCVHSIQECEICAARRAGQ